MIKPLWKDAPAWANWQAQDRDGSWFWYTEKPRPLPQGAWINNVGTKHGTPNPARVQNWANTLEQRPEGDKQ